MAEGKVVGSPAWTARLLRNTLHDTVDMLGDAAEASVQNPPKGHLSDVLRYLRGNTHREFLAGVYDANKDATERILRASFDIVTSIITILESHDPGPVSTLVLDRALGESILRVCHIHDAEARPARTLVRMAVYQLESIEGNLRTAEAFGPDGESEARRARENIQELHSMLTTHGFSRADARRPPLTAWLSFDGERESAKFNATDAYRRYLSIGSWSWAIGSGATHSMGWLLPNIVGTVDEPPLATPAQSILMTASSCIELADALARTANHYTAADVGPFLRRNHLRRIATNEAFAG